MSGKTRNQEVPGSSCHRGEKFRTETKDNMKTSRGPFLRGMTVFVWE